MKTLRVLWPTILLFILGTLVLFSIDILWIQVLCSGYILIILLDMFARHDEYIELRARYLDKDEYGVKRLIKRMSYSKCQRVAASVALEVPEKKLYPEYAWYHIFPRGFPLVMLKKSFWFSMIGLK